MSELQCGARTENHTCWFIPHPNVKVHYDLCTGWPTPFVVHDEDWDNVPLNRADPLRDAPEALRGQL